MKRSFTFILLLMVGSCAKKATPGDEFPDVATFCQEWGHRACNATVLDRCVSTTDQCVEKQQAFCESKIPDGKYSSLTAKACLDAVQSAYATAILTADQRDLVTDLTGACSKIISGSVGEDGKCTADSDCNRDVDLSCVTKAGSDSGKCAKPIAVGNGESCSDPGSVCGDGFYCDGSHCVSGGGDGEACSSSLPCGLTFRCEGTNATGGGADSGASTGGVTAGTCVALKAKADTCAADDECETRICTLNATTGMGKCSDTIVLAGSEASCATLQ